MLPATRVSPAPEKLIPLAEVVELGYASVQTLRRRVKDGSLPAVFNGSTYKVLLSDVQALYPRGATRNQPQALDDAVQSWIDSCLAEAPEYSPTEAAVIARLVTANAASAKSVA